MKDIIISVPDAGAAALMGYAVVFTGLMLLMAVILVMGKVMVARKAAKTAAAPGKDSPAAAAAPVKEGPVAPGSAGEVKLFDVPDKEAAMVMAIVANKLGKPLNQLRFQSIKEVK